jgi:uncharacterized protein (TIGR03435 family)
MRTAVLLLASLAFAQTPEFDAADVHISKAGSAPVGGFTPGGRLELRGITMLNLIMYAYGVGEDMVVGGPVWLNTDRFDVLAKAPRGTSEGTAKKMLRNLLADRFKLTFHTEDKPVSAYVLTVGKKSLLKAPAGSGAGACEQRTDSPWLTFVCQNLTIAALAQRLHEWAKGYLNHPVVDQTGLKGGYDFTLRWTAQDMLARTPDGVSIFDAVEKELGLKLEEKKQPLPALVVDSVNQIPTPNSPGVTEKLAATPTEFEVADIKPSKPGTQMNGRMQVNGRLDFQGISLKSLIQLAYDTMDDNRLVGAPKWLDSEHFDVIAKASGPVPLDALRVMMKSLLADRFKLVVHSEEQTLPVYALVVGKHGFRSQQAAGTERAGCSISVNDGVRTYTCKSTTMAQLAEQIRRYAPAYIDHPVVDATRMTGAYNFAISWTDRGRFRVPGGGLGQPTEAAQGVPPVAAPSGLTVFEAIERQLGLKLEMQKRAMPVLVIDHVNQAPTEN